MEQQGVLQRHISEICYVRICCTIIKNNEKTCARVLDFFLKIIYLCLQINKLIFIFLFVNIKI